LYFGEAQTKLDEKGRITVPRRIREVMNAQGHAIWYLTRGFDHSIFMFHRDIWNEIRSQARRHSSMDAGALDFRRLFFSSVAEAKPDAQGRMSVPPHLREHAGLDKEAVLIGVDDHLELWSPEAWSAFQQGKDAEYREMAAPLFSWEEERGGHEQKGGRWDER